MSYNSDLQANNEELQEILQQVYDLPNANSSGAEPDLVITPTENFAFTKPSVSDNYNVKKVSFNPSEVISAYEKLAAGKDIRVVLTGAMALNSWNPPFMTTQHATRALVYGPDVDDRGNWLVVRFLAAPSYFFLSSDNGELAIEYRFLISSDTGEVTLESANTYG